MVDETRVLRLLEVLGRYVKALDREARTPSGGPADEMWMAGVEFTFVHAIETCIDIAHHLMAAEGWGPQDNNADSMRVLGRQSVVSRDVAEEMAMAVKYRNVLVHQYADVNHTVTLARLGDHDVLHRFAAGVGQFLAEQSEAEGG